MSNHFKIRLIKMVFKRLTREVFKKYFWTISEIFHTSLVYKECSKIIFEQFSLVAYTCFYSNTWLVLIVLGRGKLLTIGLGRVAFQLLHIQLGTSVD